MATLIQHKRSAIAGSVPLPSQLDDGEIALNTADGVLYFKDSGGQIVTINEVHAATFAVVSNGETNFVLPTNARLIINININQLDYSEFSAITPAGGNTVIYDDVSGGYATEIGDFVRIVYV